MSAFEGNGSATAARNFDPRTTENGSSRVVGIDLGTTYSALAYVNEAGLAEVVPNSEGEKITPSVVLFEADTAIVGSVAKEALVTDPERVVQVIKRRMGSSWTFSHLGTDYRPEQISALILKKVVQDAAELIGPIESAVITVPAYFNDAMRNATKVAGKIAGLDVLALVNEPTAAAIAFGLQRTITDSTIVVYDLGGGTFDVTVMHVDGSNLTVLSTGGDNFLGGANFDKKLYDYFVAQFEQQYGIDVEDPDQVELQDLMRIAQDWLRRAERLKRDLTGRPSASTSLTALGKTMRVDVRREEFEYMSRVLLQEMEDKACETLLEAGVGPEAVDVVLLAGGSTRMPMVREQVTRIFGRPPNVSISPDEAVALGAGLFSVNRALNQGVAVTMPEHRKEHLRDIDVRDVAAHSLGIEAYDRSPSQGGQLRHSIILKRNTSLPTTGHAAYFTVARNQTSIGINVLEGEEADPEYCRGIGSLHIQGLPGGRAAGMPLQVSMRYNHDGILEVEATDEVTQMRAFATIDRSTGLAPEEEEGATAVVERLTVE